MFVGRIAETGAVVTALQTGRPVVLVGPPGMGKSALATNAARRVTDDVATVRGIATLATVPFLLFRNHVDIDADDEPDDIADAVVSTAPAALILDDLQWADPASLDVVVRIASRTAVVATVPPSLSGAAASTRPARAAVTGTTTSRVSRRTRT